MAIEAGSAARGQAPQQPATPAAATRPEASWPGLDGMRAVAVLAVVFYHIGVLTGGYLGVDVFFVLSGFLITSLLIREWDGRGRVSFRRFYARRALRLFPALSCVLVAAAVFAGLLYLAGNRADISNARATLGAIPWVVGFAGNWVRALDPSSPIGSLGALGNTWSLAVEEQFYLAWPALFVVVMRRGVSRAGIALALALLAIADMVYRFEFVRLGSGYDRFFYGTDTRCDGLLLGCSMAFWLASWRRQALSAATARLLRGAAWLGTAVMVVLFTAGQSAGAPTEISAAVLATATVVLAIVVGQAPRPLDRVLRSRTAVWIGRRSYALYLWHYIMFAAAEALVVPSTGYYPAGTLSGLIFASALTVALGATFAAAALSYRYVERPALALKRRFQTD